MRNMSLSFLIFLLLISFETGANISFSSTRLDNQQLRLTFDFILPRGDFVYQDYLDISVDHPDVSLSEWSTSINSSPYYDPSFKETKQIFNKNFTLTITAKAQGANIENAQTYLTYYQRSHKKITQKIYPLSFYEKTIQQKTNNIDPPQEQITSSVSKKQETDSTTTSWTSYISTAIKTTESRLLQLLFVFFHGLTTQSDPLHLSHDSRYHRRTSSTE